MIIRNVECRYPVSDYRPESDAKESSRREMEVLEGWAVDTGRPVAKNGVNNLRMQGTI